MCIRDSFQSGHLYHIFNQGVNRQKIFFNPSNYQFFCEKIKTQLQYNADVLCWCLMPNHFHLMVQANVNTIDYSTQSQNKQKIPHLQNSMAPNTDINTSIGILLRSYTRAINVQEKRTGALFREGTKAICLTPNDRLTSPWIEYEEITSLIIEHPEMSYPNICYNYILNNPVSAGLVKHIEDWPYSSIHEVYAENSTIINLDKIKEHGLMIY
jgi:putative transposase